MVRVHYDEGVAIHIGPESCAGGREAEREALTGECAGQPLSRPEPTEPLPKAPELQIPIAANPPSPPQPITRFGSSPQGGYWKSPAVNPDARGSGILQLAGM